MTADREQARVSLLLLLLSAVAWVALLINPGGALGLCHCAVTLSGASPASWRMLLRMNPPAGLAAGWGMMLVAMMLPTLIAPIQHIRERSFRRRWLRSAALFLVGYGLVWMVAGGFLIAGQLVLNWWSPQSWIPAVTVGGIALVWQCSPIKQRCLNRGNNHYERAAFGRAADKDACKFGIEHGYWCVGSCWALMLFPMLLPQGHTLTMLAMTGLMISERLEQPRPLDWRWRGPEKLLRIIIAQARLRLPARRAGAASPTPAN